MQPAEEERSARREAGGGDGGSGSSGNVGMSSASRDASRAVPGDGPVRLALGRSSLPASSSSSPPIGRVPGEEDFHVDDGSLRDAADDPAMQVGEGAADEDMIDAVFMNWPREQGIEATELLNLFLIHGTEPGIARLKVSELFSPPRVTERLLRPQGRQGRQELGLLTGRSSAAGPPADCPGETLLGSRVPAVHGFLGDVPEPLRPADEPGGSQEEEN